MEESAPSPAFQSKPIIMTDHKWKYRLLRLAAVVILIATALKSQAQPPANPSEDFVRASVVIASPGNTIYSSTGHAFFRMQCPSQNMDFCFSYESEPMANRVLAFLGGGLKMGMAVVPTTEFLKDYHNEGRGVTEYALNLPIKVKQNLWRVLDNRVEEGMYLPYDYMERGCAISVLHILEEALGAEEMEVTTWPESYEMTRREIVSSELNHAPWTRLVINVLTNGSANSEVEYKEKAITPVKLLELLQNSRVAGQPIVSSVPHQLEPLTVEQKAGWLTPMIISFLILLLTIGAGLAGKPLMLWVLLGIQTIIGLVNVYLVFFSSLCATEWSWLLVPFNPFPLIFWKWRKIWEIPYAAIIGIWCLAMMLVSHSLTDPALVILAFSVAFAFTCDRLIPAGVTLPAYIRKADNKNFSNLFKTKPINL